jgi:CRISPR-associated protein Cst2
MAFITGLMLINAPASALNNGQGEATKARVKAIRAGDGIYPYVSAQSFRYWLRDTMGRYIPSMSPSPVYTAGKGAKQQAYTEGDPISYWDDDLLGYMRAVKEETVTRLSPFRTSTLVSVAPIRPTEDFGVMARAEKDDDDKEGVLLHGHEFYRTVFVSLFSIDLERVGRFTDVRRTGYQNLGVATRKKASDLNLRQIDGGYELPVEERIVRVQALLQCLGRLEGGAKQTLHYTDVNPMFVMAAVTGGGNHIFGNAVKPDSTSQPIINAEAVQQMLEVYKPGEDLLSGIYAGRVAGFMDSSAATLQALGIEVSHPRQALDLLSSHLASNQHWMS